MSTSPDPPSAVSLREAARVWAKIGLQSFGGPAGQIALMHKELVERRRWIDEDRFLHALSYCTLLPGPEAQQLATYIGWLMHKTPGGLVAGLLFILPGFVTILALSMLYAGFQSLPAVSALFFGLKSAVLAVVFEAVLRVGKRALRRPAHVVIAGSAFVAIFFFSVPFPLIVLGAGLIGFALAAPSSDAPVTSEPAARAATVVEQLAPAGGLDHTAPSAGRALRALLVWGGLWLVPVALLGLVLGSGSVLFQEAVFFSKTAMVTFGGAYAVLAFIAERAVGTYGWLRPGEMLDGLGLAETTPGPLILVVQFVGFLGAYRAPEGLPPMLAGALGSIVTVWVTFVPCFLWIFLGAPYVEAVRGNRRLQGALSTITAAVVGVILNLSLWFGLHVCFAVLEPLELGPLRVLLPRWSSIDVGAVGLAGLAMVAIFRFHREVPEVLAVSAALGAAYRLLGG